MTETCFNPLSRETADPESYPLYAVEYRNTVWRERDGRKTGWLVYALANSIEDANVKLDDCREFWTRGPLPGDEFEFRIRVSPGRLSPVRPGLKGKRVWMNLVTL